MTKPNDGFHITDVIDRTGCNQHGAVKQQPCWDVIPDTNPDILARAICGSRIRAAGYVGQISESSSQTKKTRK